MTLRITASARVCVGGGGGWGGLHRWVCNYVMWTRGLCSVRLEVSWIQQNQHYVSCSSLPRTSRAWHVIIFPLCFDSISITLLPCVQPSDLPHPSILTTQNAHSLPIRETEAACAANDRLDRDYQSFWVSWFFLSIFIWEQHVILPLCGVQAGEPLCSL